MQSVSFAGVDSTVDRPYVAPDAPVAWFRRADGELAAVARDRVSPFRDLRPGRWPPPLRRRLITALCVPVQAAPVRSDGTIDLAARFHIRPDRDAPDWMVTGFQHIHTVDRKLVKHVLACGERDPGHALSTWSRILGRSISVGPLLATLQAVGCTAWQNVGPEDDLPVLYDDLPREAQLVCIEALSELREAYMTAARDAIRASGHLARARHIHQGTANRTTMTFLDDRGVLVAAAGRPDALAVASCFDCLVSGEVGTTPATLARRHAGLRREIVVRRTVAIHSPSMWGL